jgi:hypothetical protein
MPLQAGTWTLNINGSMNEFTIAVGSAGNVSGTLGLATPLIVNGFWDETAQKITMISALVGGGQAVQIYVGYLFTDPVNLLGVTGSIIFTLVGEVQQFQGSVNLGTNASAKRSVFGWYAQIGVD